MKSKILNIVWVAIFAIGSATFIGCGNSENKERESHEHKGDSTHHHDGEHARAHYQCPMDCEKGKTYEEPGQCPVCKMDLQKVEKEQ